MISVAVLESLAYHTFSNSVLLPPHSFKDLLTSGSLKRMSDLTNVLALCKSWFCESSAYNSSSNFHVDFAVASLQQYLSSEALGTKNDGTLEIPLPNFIIEQLKLLGVPKIEQQYLINMTTTAFLWQLTSSSLYKNL